jgi:hypothetical protein
MEINMNCPHAETCNKREHKVSFELPNICGIVDCNREAKTKIRIGFAFVKVCMLHAQGHEIQPTKYEDYGA